MRLSLKSVKLLVILILSFAALTACKKNGTSNPDNLQAKAAIIENIVPNRGMAGDTIIMSGTNFSSNAVENYVLFNGKKATVIAATTTRLTVKAPEDGTTGNIEIQVKNSQITIAGMFTYTQAISITGITPSKAQIGESVVITGENFRELRDDNTVLFNGIKAVLTSSNANRITATVPQGATGGKVQVLVDKQVATSTAFTLVSYPTTLAWQDVIVPTEISDRVTSASKGNIIMFYNTSAGQYSNYGKYLFRIANGQVTNVNLTSSSVYNLISSTNYFFCYSDQGLTKSSDGLTWTYVNGYGRLSSNLAVTNGRLTIYSSGMRYLSTDDGTTWTQAADPLYDMLKDHYDYAIENGNNATIRYSTDVDDRNQYGIVKLYNGGQALFKSINTGPWEKCTGNTADIFTKNGYIDYLAAGGDNVFAAYGTSTTGRSIYKSLDKGDNWFKLNNDKVNMLKKCGEYIVYGYDDFNLSFNKGHTFLKYAIPSGYIIGSIEISEKTVYLFCKNSTGVVKLIKAQL